MGNYVIEVVALAGYQTCFRSGTNLKQDTINKKSRALNALLFLPCTYFSDSVEPFPWSRPNLYVLLICICVSSGYTPREDLSLLLSKPPPCTGKSNQTSSKQEHGSRFGHRIGINGIERVIEYE